MSSTIYCLHCNTKLTGSQKKFCSSSCAAKVNNVKYPKRGPGQYSRTTCLNCDNPTKRNAKKYCSYKCMNQYHRKQTHLKVKSGEITDIRYIKRYLIEKNGHQCESCTLTEWLSGPINLEIHHIDGDRSNNSLKNFKILCPNCHSHTPNYKNKNKGNPLGIEIRQKRLDDFYYEIKS